MDSRGALRAAACAHLGVSWKAVKLSDRQSAAASNLRSLCVVKCVQRAGDGALATWHLAQL